MFGLVGSTFARPRTIAGEATVHFILFANGLPLKESQGSDSG